jgi:MFS family permease
MLVIAFIYGFTIVADSPIYNTAISDVTDPELLGIALGIQSVLGFSATTFAAFWDNLRLLFMGNSLYFDWFSYVTSSHLHDSSI